ncbi:MAG: hypothetical protein ACK5NK_16490 [Niabella sp.]
MNIFSLLKRSLLLFFIGIFYLNTSYSQIENIIIITTDGLRWQEVFNGMDSVLANNKKFNEDDSSLLYQRFWATTPEKRREKLMPFMWGYMANKGSIYGNRKYGNLVDVKNPYWFSYPGYNEIFTGYADTLVNSNNYPANPNTNLLEFLYKQNKFKGKVAAFAAWDAFDRILNEKRSGFPVINAFDTVPGNLTPQQQLINKMLLASYKPWNQSECLDVFTHFAAMEYLKINQPKILYIAYGETDEWAHGGKYFSYLNATHQFDKWIQEIWDYLQSTPAYKNKTAVFITTDHGRGDEIKEEWQHHWSTIAGSSQTWFAVIAPGIRPKQEVKIKAQYFANQFAQTMASLLKITFAANHPVGTKISL